MNILITGGAGFIGTHLRKRLVHDGHNVRVLDNLNEQVHGPEAVFTDGDVEFREGDVRDRTAVSEAVNGVEAVYHLAAETGVGQSQYEIERYVSTNTLGTAVVAQEAGKAGVRQMIVTSSRAVYGEGMHVCTNCQKRYVPCSRQAEALEQGEWEVSCPDCGGIAEATLMSVGDPTSPVSIYGMTKLQQEEIGEQVSRIFPLEVTNLRPFNVFGPGQSLNNPYVGVLGTFFRQINAGRPIDVYEDGRMRRDFVFISDVVEALMRCLGNESAFGSTYNVGSGTGVTLYEAGQRMFEAMGAEPNIGISGKFRIGDIHHAVGETDHAASGIGFRAATPFESGLAQYVRWARQQEAADPSIDAAAESLLLENACLGQAAPKKEHTA